MSDHCHNSRSSHLELSVPAEESYWPNAGQLFEYPYWHLLVAVIQPQLYAPKQLGYCGVWCGFLAVPGDVKLVLALSAAFVPRSLQWPVCIHLPIIEPHHGLCTLLSPSSASCACPQSISVSFALQQACHGFQSLLHRSFPLSTHYTRKHGMAITSV